MNKLTTPVSLSSKTNSPSKTQQQIKPSNSTSIALYARKLFAEGALPPIQASFYEPEQLCPKVQQQENNDLRKRYDWTGSINFPSIDSNSNKDFSPPRHIKKGSSRSLLHYTSYLQPQIEGSTDRSAVFHARKKNPTHLTEDNSFKSPVRPLKRDVLGHFEEQQQKILSLFNLSLDHPSDFSFSETGTSLIFSEKISPIKNRLPYSYPMEETESSTDENYLSDTETNSSIESADKSERLPPTARFLASTLAVENKTYLDVYIKDLPLERMLKKEEILLDSHTVFYTGQSKGVYLIHMFTQQLVSLIMQGVQTKRPPEDIIWLRNPLARIPVQQIFPDAPSYLHVYGDSIIDNKDRSAWNLISCSPYLFSNVFVDAMESTVDYWWDDNNVMPPNFSTIFHETFDTLNILIGKNAHEQRTTFINKLVSTIEILNTSAKKTAENNTHGVILQIFIPHNEVNQTVYISRANGVPDKNHPNALSTLLNIQTDSCHKIDHYTSMQARLLTGRFINPDLDVDYRAFAYGSFDDLAHARFKEAVAALVQEILNSAHCFPFPILPSIETEQTDVNDLSITLAELRYRNNLIKKE